VFFVIRKGEVAGGFIRSAFVFVSFWFSKGLAGAVAPKHQARGTQHRHTSTTTITNIKTTNTTTTQRQQHKHINNKRTETTNERTILSGASSRASANRKFSGLTSRSTMPLAWHCATAHRMSRTMRAAAASPYEPRLMRDHRSPPLVCACC
jgi:hypothetical protein